MSRGAVIAGHLDGQRASGCHAVQEFGKQRVVVSYPLQSGVAENDIVGLPVFVSPGGYFAFPPAQPRLGLAGGGDHLRRTVHPGQVSLGPAFRQDGGAVAWATAQVNDADRGGHGDAGRKITAGPGAFFIEAKILFGIPCRHNAGI
jgi:hypothetical protein